LCGKVCRYYAVASGKRRTTYSLTYSFNAFVGIRSFNPPGRRKGENAMRIVLLAIALIVGSSLVIPADAATRSAIAIARGECAKLAAKQHFGKRYIQRRNFIQDCLIDRGFNAQ
jgi:hypothetical protein